MSAPRPIDFKEIAGDTIKLRFVVTQGGAASDITGFELRFAAQRKGATSPTFSTPATVTTTVTDAAAGEFLVTVPAAQTQGLLGEFDWQCEVEDTFGVVQTVGRGRFIFEKSIVGS